MAVSPEAMEEAAVYRERYEQCERQVDLILLLPAQQRLPLGVTSGFSLTAGPVCFTYVQCYISGSRVFLNHDGQVHLIYTGTSISISICTGELSDTRCSLYMYGDGCPAIRTKTEIALLYKQRYLFKSGPHSSVLYCPLMT